MFLLDFFYIFIVILLSPLFLKRFFNKKSRDVLKGRVYPDISVSREKRIWIHAVSVGEVKSLENFIGELKKRFGKKIILSISTITGFEVGKNLFPDIEVINSPLDLSSVIKRFTNMIDPMVLILNELEIWPNWMKIMKKKNIPVILINGRISDRAYWRYRKFSLLLRPFFGILSKVMIQGEWYRERFENMGVSPEKILICGNIKADEAINAAKKLPPVSALKDLTGVNIRKDIFLFASTHTDDEEMFIPVLKELSERFFIIIAPRHIKRSPLIGKELSKRGLNWCLFSKNETKSCKILLFDALGYLMKLMKISKFVYMGGSLDPSVGGHNLYEPAILGKPVLGGSCYNNFPDIGSLLVKTGFYRVVNSGQSLIEEIEALSAADLDKLSETGKNAVRSGEGTVRKILSGLEEYLL